MHKFLIHHAHTPVSSCTLGGMPVAGSSSGEPGSNCTAVETLDEWRQTMEEKRCGGRSGQWRQRMTRDVIGAPFVPTHKTRSGAGFQKLHGSKHRVEPTTITRQSMLHVEEPWYGADSPHNPPL
eukprot:1149653-Pelagomonas_calceolata.AAC.9